MKYRLNEYISSAAIELERVADESKNFIGIEEKNTTKKVKEVSKALGPGLITGASDDDPSGIITYSTIGAQFGYRMNWMILLCLPLMIAVQEMCARVGLVTGKGLAKAIGTHYSKWVLYFAVSLLVIANTINIGADIGAMASVATMLTGIQADLFVIFFALLVILLEVFVSYKKYVKVLKWLTIVLFSYFLVAFFVKHDWSEIFLSLFPSISFESAFMMALVGFLGTTISPYLFFWQASEEVENEVAEHKIRAPGWGIPKIFKKDIRTMRWDVVTGMVFSQITTFFIIIATASTLHTNGIFDIQSAEQAASALKPFAGDFAYLLFGLGIIGTGILAVPVLAGSAAYGLSEMFGWKYGLYRSFRQAKNFYLVIILSTFVGMLLTFLGVNPMKALYYTAIANGVVAPPLILMILLLANNKKIMGNKTNGFWSNFLGITAFIFMSAAAVLLFVYWGE